MTLSLQSPLTSRNQTLIIGENFMRHLRSVVVFVVVLVLISDVATARAGVISIVDNSNSGTAALVVPINSSSIASSLRGYSFTVGSSGINLSSITFGLYGNAVGQANVGVRLFSGSGAGGTVLQDTGTTLLNLTTTANGAGYYSNAVNWSLNANTTYSIMAYGSTVTTTPRLAATSQSLSLNPAVTGVGFYAGSSVTTDNFAVWFQATGSASSVPEINPAGISSVMAFVAGALGFIKRRRMKIV